MPRFSTLRAKNALRIASYIQILMSTSFLRLGETHSGLKYAAQGRRGHSWTFPSRTPPGYDHLNVRKLVDIILALGLRLLLRLRISNKVVSMFFHV